MNLNSHVEPRLHAELAASRRAAAERHRVLADVRAAERRRLRARFAAALHAFARRLEPTPSPSPSVNAPPR